MAEHRFTDETATIAVLHSLVNDMHHALGRIAQVCITVAFAAVVMAGVDALRGLWFSMTLDLGSAAVIFAMGYETRARRSKYHPTTTATGGDGRG